MPDDDPQKSLDLALSALGTLEPNLRNSALRAVSAYVEYLIQTGGWGGTGAGPVATAPRGSPTTTRGTFICPKCGGTCTANYT